MKRYIFCSFLFVSNYVMASVEYGNPELTTTQPGLGAGVSSAKYPGKGFVGAVTLGHYNIRGVNLDGKNVSNDEYTSLDVILPHLSYYTDQKLLGGYYSFGITGVYGAIYQGDKDNGLGMSKSPWFNPIRLNWNITDDLSASASYSFRLGVKGSPNIVDKSYDMHAFNSNVTYDINDFWQWNGAIQYEYRSPNSDNGLSWQAGDIGYIETSLIRKFDNGMALGGYAYHIGHLNKDRGEQYSDSKLLKMGKYNSSVSAIGVSFTTPIEIIKSTLSLNIHEEFSQENHTYGTRAFVTIAHKF